MSNSYLILICFLNLYVVKKCKMWEKDQSLMTKKERKHIHHRIKAFFFLPM